MTTGYERARASCKSLGSGTTHTQLLQGQRSPPHWAAGLRLVTAQGRTHRERSAGSRNDQPCHQHNKRHHARSHDPRIGTCAARVRRRVCGEAVMEGPGRIAHSHLRHSQLRHSQLGRVRGAVDGGDSMSQRLVTSRGIDRRLLMHAKHAQNDRGRDEQQHQLSPSTRPPPNPQHPATVQHWRPRSAKTLPDRISAKCRGGNHHDPAASNRRRPARIIHSSGCFRGRTCSLRPAPPGTTADDRSQR